MADKDDTFVISVKSQGLVCGGHAMFNVLKRGVSGFDGQKGLESRCPLI